MPKIKLAILLLVFMAFAVLVPNLLFAQDELTFERAYADYVHNLDLYRKARDKYELARANYLGSKTLASKSTAEAATLKMLQLRDEVVITHLTALRKKISDTSGVSSSDRDSYFSQIDAEVAWYKNHKDGLGSAVTLENLVNESQKAKERYQGSTEPLMYKSLALVQTGKLDGFRERLEKIVSELSAKIAEIRVNGDKETQKGERWLIEVDSRISRSRQKEDAAKVIISSLEKDISGRDSKFDQFQILGVESNQFMKEAVSYLKEIVKEIMTAD